MISIVDAALLRASLYLLLITVITIIRLSGCILAIAALLASSTTIGHLTATIR